MPLWDDFNKALKTNPFGRVFSAAAEATYNVIPKSENLAVGTYESGTPTPIPNPDSNKSPQENYFDGAADNTVERISGWDSEKSATQNVYNGFKVVTDGFGNAAKAASELGTSLTNGVKKWGPLAAAGVLAVLLLKK